MFPRRFFLLLAVMLAVPLGAALTVQPTTTRAAVSNPAPNQETLALIAAINSYRQGQGLPAIPVSPELTAVAVAHVRDLTAFFATDPNYTGTDCVMHGWSSHGNWTGGCYKFADSSTYPIMWNKPKEIANYPGQGFEILAETMGTPMTADTALRLWAADPPHNDVIVNQGIWKDMTWKAMGVWVEGGWASVWFGAETDPTPPSAVTVVTPTPESAVTGPAPAAPATGASPVASPVAMPATPTGNGGNASGNAAGNASGNASGNQSGNMSG